MSISQNEPSVPVRRLRRPAWLVIALAVITAVVPAIVSLFGSDSEHRPDLQILFLPGAVAAAATSPSWVPAPMASHTMLGWPASVAAGDVAWAPPRQPIAARPTASSSDLAPPDGPEFCAASSSQDVSTILDEADALYFAQEFAAAILRYRCAEGRLAAEQRRPLRAQVLNAARLVNRKPLNIERDAREMNRLFTRNLED